ncbi:Asp-tRNA(Asn)/Glu-tRNA(Gln) amidotransferase subunit GatC [Halovivax gelatinilyticus]|uniref:Asp-tRNA(Asn)/Glu-tRNA(Gln) amidotransferase subunit GatC n=1 Tax=Halovivax gelatinilyticus TaxID=2961597 RepID=UPI0020CA2D80|nr:Asp-tRNA(Asn)/Glu-tRNA(Gln) amidotransferase subunit GatC [Halovivax gelatinilyticus]
MSNDAVSPDDVRHVGELARVNLSDEEVAQFTDDFSEIVEAFDVLDDVPSVDREAPLTNVLRPDESRETLNADQIFANAPETEDGRFKGPNVS